MKHLKHWGIKSVFTLAKWCIKIHLIGSFCAFVWSQSHHITRLCVLNRFPTTQADSPREQRWTLSIQIVWERNQDQTMITAAAFGKSQHLQAVKRNLFPPLRRRDGWGCSATSHGVCCGWRTLYFVRLFWSFTIRLLNGSTTQLKNKRFCTLSNTHFYSTWTMKNDYLIWKVKKKMKNMWKMQM